MRSCWRAIREDKRFFVDKTEKLSFLVQNCPRVFFSRPRRMGKTSLCYTLEELFAYGDQNFEGTAIYGKWPFTERYPVISLSFLGIHCKDAREFEASLCTKMANAYNKAGFHEAVKYQNIKSFATLTGHLDTLTADKRLVFLIDEWDYPLSSHLDDQELFAALQEVMNDFYNWLREQTLAKFVLITGIMRYRDVSLFTGKDIKDISMDPYYADLVGYTQTEFESKFAPYIQIAATKLGITTDELKEQLKLHYDGFCFDNQASVNMYCPIAINKFFAPLDNPNFRKRANAKLSFEPFWMGNSGATAALRSFLGRRKYDVTKILEKYSKPVIMGNEDMTSPVKATDVTLDQIMLQSGMLSIKELTEDSKHASTVVERSYKCELTNYEVASEFRTVLIAYMANADEADVYHKLLQVQQALLSGNIAKLCATINQLLCNSRYDIFDEEDDKKERIYRTFFKLCMMSHLVNADDEVSNNHGRCDLVASTKDTIYAFELKRVSSDTAAAKFALLDEAEQQLVKNDYGNNLIKEGKLLLWVVVVISDKYRQTCAWRTIKRTYSSAGPQIERHEALVEPIKVENQKGS